MNHPLLEESNGNERTYRQTYTEDSILGHGEFGIVKLVHLTIATASNDTKTTTITNNNKDPGILSSTSTVSYASKCLPKGAIFQNNTLLFPLKPEVLRREIQILRKLQVRKETNASTNTTTTTTTSNIDTNCNNNFHYCLQLHAVYESRHSIYIITEYCSGGTIPTYIANYCYKDLMHAKNNNTIERIAYQMLDSIRHCHDQCILHRDVKPENWMFTNPSPDADGRLIDFGSSALDTKSQQYHTTFAGSAFYISPEMFQHKYTSATDIWSIGATLYVLVAGYPADHLQSAFNILQTAHNRNLRTLPNMPNNLPDSFYSLLDQCLTYQYTKRPSAQQLLQHEFFSSLHELSMEPPVAKAEVLLSSSSPSLVSSNQAIESIENVASTNPESRMTVPNALESSVVRHNLVLGFQQFECAVTTLLVTMLSTMELQQLLQSLQNQTIAKQNDIASNNSQYESTISPSSSSINKQQQQMLVVISVSELKSIISNVLKHDPALEAMNALPNASLYDSFAYHTALLNEFSHPNNDANFIGNAASLSASLGRRRRQKQRHGGRRSRSGNKYKPQRNPSGSLRDGSISSLGQ